MLQIENKQLVNDGFMAVLLAATEVVQNILQTSGKGRLWWPALGVVKTLHTDNKQHTENMKT